MQKKSDVKQGRDTMKTMKNHIGKFKLRCKEVTPNEARIAIMKGRIVLSRFELDEKKWHNFKQFFENNPKGVLTKKIIEKPVKHTEEKKGGHAVVLISIEENCLAFLNSWGNSWGDKGYFRIENENVLDEM